MRGCSKVRRFESLKVEKKPAGKIPASSHEGEAFMKTLAEHG
jgi:hypothetical protein